MSDDSRQRSYVRKTNFDPVVQRSGLKTSLLVRRGLEFNSRGSEIEHAVANG